MATTLSVGDRGSDVQTLQQQLNVFGYGLEIDGVFGQKTHDAVVDFQMKRGLTADGVVGSNTHAELASGGALVVKPQSTSVAPVMSQSNFLARPGMLGFPLWVELSVLGIVAYGLTAGGFIREALKES